MGSIPYRFFLKVATTLADLLFIELKLHFSNVKEMYSQPKHLLHVLVLSIQITRGRVDFNRDSTAGAQFSTCNLLTQIFYALKPDLCYNFWPLSRLHTVMPHSSGLYSGGLLCTFSKSAIVSLWI